MPAYVGAIDQGTTSSRFIVFDATARSCRSAQREHEQIYPKPGYVEHDPAGDLAQHAGRHRARRSRRRACTPRDLAAVGITNQRETTLLLGPPHRRAAAQRARLAGHAGRRPRRRASRATAARTACAPRPACRSRAISPASSCDGCSTTCPARAEKAEAGDALFGTIDTWLVWNLTGGRGRRPATSPT